MELHIRVDEDRPPEIVGGELDGAPVNVIDMRVAPLVLVMDGYGRISVRGTLPHMESVRVLREVADRMERDYRKAKGDEPADDDPAADA